MASSEVIGMTPKPPSKAFKGYGQKAKTVFSSTIGDKHVLRDNFSISTWLLMGASMQCILLALPLRPSYALLPALSLLSYRFITWLLMCFGIISHPYAHGVINGKLSAVMHESYDMEGKKKDDGGICVIMLSARCNSPLGLFAPHWEGVSNRMQSLIATLEADAPSNGFLGGNNWLNTSDRTTGSEVMVLAYFKSHVDLQAFAHGKQHREVWDWWNCLTRERKVGHLSIAHEVYCSRAGEWEGIYTNMAPSMFHATSHWVVDEDGKGKWVSPVVKGNGRFRSALGRMGKSLGDDNEKYGEEPYEDV